MSITLAGIPLPADLEWTDEFSYTPIRQRTETTLSGALIVEETAQAKGRPITLAGGDDAAWVTRATVDALYALTSAAGATHALDYHGTAYTVGLRHSEGPIEARQVVRLANPGAMPAHFYTITIRMFEV